MSLDETDLPTLNILKLPRPNRICFWILKMKIWTAFVMTKRKPITQERVEDFVPDYDYVVELMREFNKLEKKDDGIQ